MDVVIKILQLLLSLSILVIIHEFGHFIAAKIFKTKVEKFYLFFNPWFSIFKFKYGETEYGMGWLPLGGYVKIAGMIDESMDKEQLKRPPESWEFRSKPAWQRLIIMLGGVTMNIILAILIYITMLSVWGQEYIPTSEVKYGIKVDSLGYQAGLRDGDKILSVDGEYVENFMKIPRKLILDGAKDIQVERDGKVVDVKLPEDFIAQLIDKKAPGFMTFRIPFEVSSFTKNSVAKESGMKVDDKIIALNGQPAAYFQDFVTKLQNHKGKDVVVTVVRGADTLDLSMVVPEGGKLGVYNKTPDTYFNLNKVNYSVGKAIPAGFTMAYDEIGDYLKQLKLIFNPDVQAYKSVGGFGTIASIFPPEWHWQSFWSLTAFLSIMLAVLNVLPIPALDGGHVMFLIYEIVTRRKPNDKFMEYAQITGMIILLALLLFANGNDIIRYFGR